MDKVLKSRVGELNIMDRSGHTQMKWSMDRLEEIAAAEDAFNRLITKGYSAFGSKTGAMPKESLYTFDSSMEEIVMVPRIVGG